MAPPERTCTEPCQAPDDDLDALPPSCEDCQNGARQYDREPNLRRIVPPEQDRLLAARDKFLADGIVPDGIPLAILRSWRRSARYGLDSGSRQKGVTLLSESAFGETLDRNEELMRAAWGELELLCRDTQLVGGVVVLTDPNGVVLLRLGDNAFAEEADRLGLTAGGDWSEPVVGTNAIGTAVSERHPLSVIGAEHFSNLNTIISCSAVPIVDPCGVLCGILDLSTPAAVAHDYTLPLLRRAAGEIERRIFEKRCGLNEQMHLHSNPYLLGSPNEGLLAFDGDRLVGANRNAIDLLGLSWSAIGTIRFRQVFSVQHGSVMRHASADECVVQTVRGSTFFARLQTPRGLLRAVPGTLGGEATPHPVLAGAEEALPHVVLETLQKEGGPRFQRMKAGHLIYGAGLMDETGEAVLVVAGGQFRCFSSHEGKELTLFMLGPGDAVPLQPEMVVEVRKDGEAAILSRATFRQLVRSHPEFGMCILPAVEKMLNRSLAMVEEMAFRSVRYRLIRFICEMAEREGRTTPEGVIIEAAPQGDDLAMAIGAARQSVSTVLADLVRGGDIQRRAPRSILVANVAQLREELRVLR